MLAQGKVESNFSNYSAWHYRTKLIPTLCASPAALQGQIAEEFDSVQQAVFTEPDDQSAWFCPWAPGFGGGENGF